jgi:hypothetical protein
MYVLALLSFPLRIDQLPYYRFVRLPTLQYVSFRLVN